MSKIDTQRLVREILGVSAVAIIEEEKALRAEIAALREQVRQSAEVLQLLRYEMRPPQVQWYYDWLARPAVRRALEERP